MSAIITIFVIILLLFINALYVAAQFSAVIVKRPRIEKMAEDGHYMARMLLPVISDSRKLDNYVSTCQMGITVASLILGAFGEARIAVHIVPLFVRLGGFKTVAAHSASAVIVLISLSVVQMLFGEFVPKTLALQYGRTIALYTIIPLKWSQFIFSWFILILNGTGIGVLKILGVPVVRQRHIHSPEEIDFLITESHEGGVLEPDEHKRLHKALSLSGRQVRHLMVPRAHMCVINSNESLKDVIKKISSSPYSRLPVYSETVDNITGILHVKEAIAKYLNKEEIKSIKEILRPVLFIPENMRADRLMKIFREEYSEMAVVVDEFGGVAGIITIEDLMTEVLGYISDEFKDVKVKYENLSDGRIRIKGSVSAHIDEIAWITGLTWKGESITIGGQIIEVLGRIPEEGENIYIDGVKIKIEKVNKNTIESLIIKPL